MASARVLVVDDEPEIRRFLTQALVAQGITVETAGDGAAALRRLQRDPYDVMLLDVMMAGGSGVELLPSVFEVRPGQRVIMISALTEPRTRVRCLDLGAVDYVSKPFSLAELVARVRVHLRPAPAGGAPREELRRGERRVGDRRVAERRQERAEVTGEPTDDRFIRTRDGTLDLRRRRLHVLGQLVELSEREALVLAHMMRRAGEVCSRQEVLDDVWGPGGAQTSNVVEVYVTRLRAKLPGDLITTVRNVGYSYGA